MSSPKKKTEDKAARMEEKKNYLGMMSEIYGLFVFIFTKFSRTSSYPFINRQDFKNVLKIMKISTK